MERPISQRSTVDPVAVHSFFQRSAEGGVLELQCTTCVIREASFDQGKRTVPRDSGIYLFVYLFIYIYIYLFVFMYIINN